MISVAVNCRVLEKPTLTGVGRYTLELLDGVASSETDGSLSVLTFGAEKLPEAIADHDVIENANEPAWAHSGLKAQLWDQFSLPRTLGKHDVDLLHVPAGQPPILVRGPMITTVHDISPIVHPDWFSPKYAALYRVLTPLAMRASDRIVTVSEFARSEIVTRYPAASGKTVAIHNGVTPRDPADGSPVKGLSPARFLLFVGSLNPRKNLDGVVRAYRQYRSQTTDPVPLALAGASHSNFASKDRPDVDGVRTLGYVSESELTWLYHNARALVFPSLYEGFGLPILEAMSAGTPVITSDRGAMAEVAGDAARLVDPTDPADIARGILRVLEDDEYADTLSETGEERSAEFTWERTARETLDVYREVANL